MSILILKDKNKFPNVSLNSSKQFILTGWNLDTHKIDKVNISFKGVKDQIWMFEKCQNIKEANAQSKYTKEEYLNSIIQCIDPQLKSIYGRTGEVIQIIPGTDIIELDIDFGRGIGIVRLTEQQIKIISV